MIFFPNLSWSEEESRPKIRTCRVNDIWTLFDDHDVRARFMNLLYVYLFFPTHAKTATYEFEWRWWPCDNGSGGQVMIAMVAR